MSNITNLPVFPHTIGNLDDKPNLPADEMKAKFEHDVMTLWDRLREAIPSLNGKFDSENIVKAVNHDSTDSKVPTAKAVYTAIEEALVGDDGSTAAQIITDWLDDHPDATTTVQDGAVHYYKLSSELRKSIDGGLTPLKSNWVRGSINNDGSINAATTWRLTTEDVISYDRVIKFTIGSGYKAAYAIFNSDNTVTRGFITNGMVMQPGTSFRASIYKENEAVSDDPTLFYKNININSPVNVFLSGAYLNISSSNRAAICQSDLNKLPLNNIYGVVPDDGLLNCPTSESGLFYSVSKDRVLNSTAVRYYVTQSGKVYLGMYWGSSWQDWSLIPTTDMVAATNTIIPSQSSNYAHLLSNISTSVCMLATASNWDDTPLGRSGYFESQKYGSSYALQTFISWAPWTKHYRVVNVTNNTVYSDWADAAYIAPMKVLALGDSICYGYRNGLKGFVGDLGLPYKNIGVSGASLSNIVTSATNIPDQLVAETDYNPDIIIADGGINDYIQGATLGTIPTAPVANDTEAAALDRSTVMGGAAYLFYQMIKKFPAAQRFFVITHKTYRPHAGIYYPTYLNAASPRYTQQDLHDALVAICNVYNVKVVDVYNDSMINTIFPAYVSATDYDSDHSVTDTEYVNSDGVHPLALGYKEGYVPLIKQAIGIGTTNPVTE